MAERVEIMVVAQDNASQVLRGISSSFGGIGTAIQSITGGRILETLTSEIVKFGKEGVDATLKYANEVRQLSMASGQSAENSSRFLQVLDDYKLSAQDAMLATKALTKEGLAPNMDTLAKLSDEYLTLNSAQARNEFIMKNLGKGGLQWAEVLGKGSKALREQGDAIADNLILNQQALDDAREYEIAMDSLNDSVMGLKMAIGQHLIPVLTDQMNVMRDDARAMEILEEQGISTFWATMKQQQAAKEQAIAERESADATMLAAKALQNNTEAAVENEEATKEQKEAIKAAEEAMQKMTEANREHLSILGDLTNAQRDHEETLQDIINTQEDLVAEKLDLISKGYSEEGKKISEVNEKLDEQGEKYNKAAADFERSTRRRILAMLEEELALDGLQNHEVAYLEMKGVEWGIYTKEQILELQKIRAEIALYVSEVNGIPTSHTTTIYTNYVNQGPTSLMGSGYWDSEHMAGGGGVNVGQMYQVNETRKEFFKPSMSGEVIPLGGGNGSGGGSGGVTVVLQPTIMTADRASIDNVLLPSIIAGVRKAKADGII